MFKDNQIWIITFLDLLMLLVCFFVMVFSVNLIKINKEETSPLFDHKAIKTSDQQISASLRIIFDNLQSYYKDKSDKVKIEVMTSPQQIRILPSINLEDTSKYEDIVRDLSGHVFNFTKNSVRISLLLNYDKLLENAAEKDENINLKINKLIHGLKKFSGDISSKSNNENIQTFIDIHSEYPLIKQKEWLIAADILPEAN